MNANTSKPNDSIDPDDSRDLVSWEDVMRSATPPAAKPSVPVFCNVPRKAADRAIEAFQRRRDLVESGAVEPDATARLVEYLQMEISEQPVYYVDGEPLGEYAIDLVDSVTIEPGDD